jgi:hypothetical protein
VDDKENQSRTGGHFRSTRTGCIRTSSHHQTYVFLDCSIISPASFELGQNQYPEIQLHMPRALVGTKSDFRGDRAMTSQMESKGLKMIDKEQVLGPASEIGAEYLECSALTQLALRPLFERAIRVGVEFTEDLQSEKEENAHSCNALITISLHFSR